MQYGVKEYWIVNPLLNTVQIYVLNEEGQYHQVEVLKETGIAHSEVLKGFSMNIEELFKWVLHSNFQLFMLKEK